MDTTVDTLKIKIDKARAELPKETLEAINAVDWKTLILAMRAEKGFSYTQLEDLEIETELLLCGLLNPEDYPKELEKRMLMPKAKIAELVEEMNLKIFSKIREELIKNIERNKISESRQTNKPKKFFDPDKKPLESREEMLKTIENVDLSAQKELPAGNKDELKGEPLKNSPRVPLDNSILNRKLSGTFKTQSVETDHSLSNMTRVEETRSKIPPVDPYREIPE